MNINEHIWLWNQAAIRVLDVRHILMDTGETLESYRLPANGFIHITRGRAQMQVNGTSYEAEQFHVIHSGKGMWLQIASLEEQLEYYLILYRHAYPLPSSRELQKVLDRHNTSHVQYLLNPVHPVLIKDLVLKMHGEWNAGSNLQKFQVKSLFLQFVYELLRQMKAQGVEVTSTDLVSQAIRYIHEYYSSPITVDSLAEILECSPRHLSRLFQKSTLQRTPSDYLIGIRMNKASELLRQTKLTLQEIATNVGYQDGYYFSRMFKKYTGYSPLEYRNRSNTGQSGPDITSPVSDYSIAAHRPRRYIDNNNHNQLEGGGKTVSYSNLRRSAAMMLFISLTLLLGACSSPANPAPVQNNANSSSGEAAEPSQAGTAAQAGTRSIAHDLGNTDVPESPQRIIVLEQGFTQVVAALQIKPVGVADDGRPERFPKETLAYIEGYTSVGGRSEPNMEVMRTLKPDLIIADTSRHTNVYEQLSAIAPTIVLKNDTANYEQTLAATRTIGEALGKAEEAEALLTEHQEKVEQLKKDIDANQSVLIISPDEDAGNTFQVRTGSAFHPSFLASLGLNYKLSDDSEVSQLMTIEQILAIDPDILLILINEDTDSVIAAQEGNPLWAQLKAVQTGHVHEVELATWSRQRSIMTLNQIMDEAAGYF
ncbi:ABC transporter substrate-binding protein [Paenibacillus sp. S150]|uniref:ABC transporter substrate-binding protein n=1 Tax=Paenibacillus sp. S150 TaxID=2749826 RepID=UPI001C57E5A9|nr:ABC transporter substrate-binding protein [Paenibacillus sp. S150]MBW4084168.1 ABC transporter substrate-binding protein [Paenibacillus sp. S150]